MVGKLFYIHGYQSSPDGTKGVFFNKALQAVPLNYRDVPPEELIISECLQQIKKNIFSEEQVILIGSSLGGFLAAMTALQMNNVVKIFLLNPAIMPPDTDISKINSMPKRILSEMKVPELFSTKLASEIVIFRGTDDTIVPDEWVLQFASYQESIVHFLKDDHRFSRKLELVTKVLKEYLKKT